MLAKPNFTDPWLQTIGLLSVLSGDSIYKPRPCRPAPPNTGAMILRSVVNEAVIG